MAGEAPRSPQRAGAQRQVGQLAATVLSFDLEAEIARLKTEDAWGLESHNGKTLVKEPDFRIVLIVMKSGAKLAEHQAAGRISIQPLNGTLLVHLRDREVELSAGGLLALDRQVPHGVEAREESSLLLTIVWPAGSAQGQMGP